MKRTTSIIVNLLVIGWTSFALTSCGYSSWMVGNDDVYGTVPSRAENRAYNYSSQDLMQQNDQQENIENYDLASTATEAYVGENPEIYNTDTVFDFDDYYDYEYSSRLKRFHEEEYVTDDYYSDYYTNSYWYNYDPFYYGSSIYLGYNWWYPNYSYYRPGWFMGFGFGPFPFDWGWPNYYFGYWPSYSWGYNNGYWDGYWNGYHDALYDYCYNPYDNNTYNQSYYNRRRGESSLTNPTVVRKVDGVVNSASLSTSNRTDVISPNRTLTFAEKYESAQSNGSIGGSSTHREPNTGTSIRETVTANNSISSKVETSTNGSNVATTNPVRKGGIDRDYSTPSKMMSQVSSRLSASEGQKETSVSTSLRTGNKVSSMQSNTIRGNTQTVRSSTGNPYRNSSSAVQNGTSTSQPRQYTTPTYNGVRSNSSYTSPQYNRQSNSSYYRSNGSGSSSNRPVSTPTRSTYNSTERSSVERSSVSSPSSYSGSSRSTNSSSSGSNYRGSSSSSSSSSSHRR